jgi:outer membrane protein TolC
MLVGVAKDALETPESHFPDLAKIVKALPTTSPQVLEHDLVLEEYRAKARSVSSIKGTKVGIAVSGYSIYEDRPNADYDQRWKAFSRLNFSKPLYHWGALEDDIEIAKIMSQNSSGEASIFQRNAISRTRSSYLHLVASSLRKKLAQERLKLATKLFESSKEKKRLGMIDEIVVQDLENQLLSSQMEFREIEINLNYELSSFVEFTGYTEPINLDASDQFFNFCLTHQFSSSEPVLIQSSTSAESEKLDNLIKIEELKIGIAEKSLLPKFNLSGAYFQDQVDLADSSQPLDRNNILVGLEANWEIWDSHKSKSDKDAAIARKKKLELAKQRLMRERGLELKFLNNQLSLSRQKIVLSQKQYAIAKRKLSKSLIEFEQNKISSLENFQSHLEADEARLENLDSVCSYFILLDKFDSMFHK